MLAAVSPLRYNTTTAKDERDNSNDIIESFADFITDDGNNLLETINFDDLFTGINDGYDVLPNLDMDSEIILAEFSVSSGDDESDINNNNTPSSQDNNSSRKEEQGLNQSVSHKSEESGSKKSKVNNKVCKKSSGQSNKPEGKRKVKVDWTPELHRRFVQAVEQLGIDKAVPSRILELMDIEGLTRHNIASHLQKYRSHRKHLLAREAEAASWSQRRQLYNATTVGGGGGGKRDINNPWAGAPTMGFPPMPHFRPLHVWGHPSADHQSLMHVWPKHPPPPPAWAPIVPPHPSPPPVPSFWHPHHQGAPSAHCFPAPIAPMTFPALPVQGMPPCAAMIKTAHSAGPGQDSPPCDFHPSKENIDEAIEDVLAKPNLPPLPLGLKPPSIDSVLKELQRQGITKIPPIVSGS